MKSALIGTLTALITVIVAPTAGNAGSVPPAALIGKSVMVSWDEARLQRVVGEANFRSVSAVHNLSIYISSAGRVFSRQTITIGSRSGSGYQVAGEGRPQAARVPSFSGQTMTFYAPMQSGGIRRQIIVFDASFTSCTLTASFAKEPGKAAGITGSIINPQNLVEIQSIIVSNAKCSVQNGNVFGGA